MPTIRPSKEHLPFLIEVYERAFKKIGLKDHRNQESERLARCVLNAGSLTDDPARMLTETIQLYKDGNSFEMPAATIALKDFLQGLEERFNQTLG